MKVYHEKNKMFYVYILSLFKDRKFSCYYTGQTNNLRARKLEHFNSIRQHKRNTFVGRFDYARLKCYIKIPTREEAVKLEKYIKTLKPNQKVEFMKSFRK